MTATTPRPYSILITDDDIGCRQALRDIMEPEGYRTYLASSGEEAVDIVQQEPIHLAMRVRIQVADIRSKTLANERVQTEVGAGRFRSGFTGAAGKFG